MAIWRINDDRRASFTVDPHELRSAINPELVVSADTGGTCRTISIPFAPVKAVVFEEIFLVSGGFLLGQRRFVCELSGPFSGVIVPAFHTP